MKYNTGDKVRFLNDVGGGTISRIINSGMVSVMDEDGFEIPVRVSEIVVVERNDSASIKNEAAIQKNISMPQKTESTLELPDTKIVDSDDYEILIAFVPVDDGANISVPDLDLYFINNSSFYCTYIVSYRTKTEKLNLLGQDIAEPETVTHVCSIAKDDFAIRLNLHITVCFHKQEKEYKYYPPEQINLDLNPVKFTKKSVFTANDFFDTNACVMKIATNTVHESPFHINPRELENAIKQKDTQDTATEEIRQNKSDVEEVDLHIEELIEDAQGLDSLQIFELQKARFITAMESGLTSGAKKIVFIHGVGNGRLKLEIRRLLDTQYAGLVRYHDASFREYGFGATMVILS
jgi:hypothetical protein